jgi:hypothetical protein
MSSRGAQSTEQTHRLPGADGARRQLKRNILEAAQVSNTQLCPVLPYLGEGAMTLAFAMFKREVVEADATAMPQEPTEVVPDH